MKTRLSVFLKTLPFNKEEEFEDDEFLVEYTSNNQPYKCNEISK